MEKRDWIAIANDLGRGFGERSAEHDASDVFVADNYAVLKENGLLAAGVPAELGGGGASIAELAMMIRTLARHCSSTGLAFSMHTHIVAAMAFNWRNGNKATEAMLKRVVAEKVLLVSNGGADWLDGTGTLVKVDGGYRLTGRKIFSSGVPAGDFLMTTGVYDDPEAGRTVFHFPVSLKSEGVKVLDTWRALGMRSTGSHDVELTDVFVPEASVGVRRASGKWHPAMHVVVLAAFPILYGAYVGVAEAARDLAVRVATKKRNDPTTQVLAGELEMHLATAQLAHEGMMSLATAGVPGAAASVANMTRRNLLANGVLRTVDKALEVAGGSAFYRAAGLERLFRDAQGVRFHPVQEKPGTKLIGRHVLGLDLDD